MAKLRKFVAYRNLKRPYTRTSKYKDNAFVKTKPPLRITRFETGNAQKRFGYTLNLLSKSALHIRDNALESARTTSNKLLETNVGLANYHLRIKVYPFQVLRENPLATGAGADRFSTGMQKAFGKPIGNAARVRNGQTLIEISTDKNNVLMAKAAIKRAASKLPCQCTIQVVKNF